ncbi:MAG: hypothetical protein AB7U38_13990, partial [Hyphomicrobiales bacterium]
MAACAPADRLPMTSTGAIQENPIMRSISRRRFHCLAVGGLAASAMAGGRPASAQEGQEVFASLLSAPHRRPGNVARDRFRHPAETLAFFGVGRDSIVVEILPGSAGYYMEILAPFLRGRGKYIAAGRDAAAPENYRIDHQKLLDRLRAEPALYDQVQVTEFNSDRHRIAPDASADFVLTFRNLH